MRNSAVTHDVALACCARRRWPSTGCMWPTVRLTICSKISGSSSSGYSRFNSGVMVWSSISLLLIHHVDQRLAGREALDVLSRRTYHSRVILVGTSGHVRRDDRVAESPKRMAFRQRLRLGYIHACAG